jgi:radical SAM protein with 4Fe4S-binding SPASM domain
MGIKIMKKAPHYEITRNQRVDLREALPLDMPLSLNIEPTNVCNFKCKICAQSFDDFKDIEGYPGYMTLDLCKKIMLDIKNMLPDKKGKLKTLRLYLNGEPLLNKDIIEIIQMAHDLDITNRIELFSNGTLLNGEIIEKLIDSPLDYLRISIYSIYNNNNKEITQSDFNADVVYENVKNFVQIKNEKNKKTPFITVKFIRNNEKQEEDEFLNLYKNLADEAYTEPVMNWNGYEGRELAENLYENAEKDIEKNILTSKKICAIPFYSLIIRCNGDVTACCADWHGDTKVGNIKEESLYDIWHGQKLKELRKMLINGERYKNKACKNCTYYHIFTDNIDNLPEERYKEILGD